jgi:hypothetical protein
MHQLKNTNYGFERIQENDRINMDNQTEKTMSTCICCNLPAEWVDKWCQEHWESECDRTWWEMVLRNSRLDLPESKHHQT